MQSSSGFVLGRGLTFSGGVVAVAALQGVLRMREYAALEEPEPDGATSGTELRPKAQVPLPHHLQRWPGGVELLLKAKADEAQLAKAKAALPEVRLSR